VGKEGQICKLQIVRRPYSAVPPWLLFTQKGGNPCRWLYSTVSLETTSRGLPVWRPTLSRGIRMRR